MAEKTQTDRDRNERESRDSRKRVRLLKKAAVRGDAEAGVLAARAYMGGQGVPKNEKKGVKILERFAGTDNAEVHIGLGLAYHLGLGGKTQDLEKAKEHYRIAAVQGNAPAQRALGILLLYGGEEREENNREAEKDCRETGKDKTESESANSQRLQEAAEWLRKAAAQGDFPACLHLAKLFDRENQGQGPEKGALGGPDENMTKVSQYIAQAEKAITRMKEVGEPTADAHKELGDLYRELSAPSCGPDRDEKRECRALEHYCKAYLEGKKSAVCDVCRMVFLEGCSSPFLKLNHLQPAKLIEDLEELEKESEWDGDGSIQLLLGDIYDRCPEVSAMSWREAEYYYKMAWFRHSTEAGWRLADYYRRKRWIDNYIEILKSLYEKGEHYAAYELGRCYECGLGVEEDAGKAADLFRETAKAGIAEAAQMLKLMRSEDYFFQRAQSLGRHIDGGEDHMAWLRMEGSILCVGNRQELACYVDSWGALDLVGVACGTRYTVGLKKDGTVVGTGREDFGQRDVSDWKDIIAIAAGHHHTAGLRKDGRVVAVGDNTFGQCDVSDWKDLIAVACGGDCTVGLKSDNTVVTTLDRDVSGWNKIVVVAAGKGFVAGLREDGSVLVTQGADGKEICDVSEWNNIQAIACGDGHIVGLRPDGTVLAAGDNGEEQCEVADWQNIKALACGGQMTFGWKIGNEVVAAGPRGWVTQELDQIQHGPRLIYIDPPPRKMWIKNRWPF